MRSFRRSLSLAMTCLVFSLSVQASAQSSSRSTSGTTSAKPSTTVRATNAEAAPIDPRRFPTIDLGRLTETQQRSFMRVVDSELCPCEGSTLSLGECLEDSRGTCGLARELTMRVAQGVQRGESDTAIARALATATREAQTVHTFDLRNVPYKGASRPKVTMVSFADYECPYCRELARITDDLLKQYPNDLRVYFMNFPLSGHPHAQEAALASLAAQNQGKFWEYHDLIFFNQGQLSRSMDPLPLFLRWAETLGLNVDTFQRDMEDPRLYDRVQAERNAALAAGARGTPSVYLNGQRLLDIDSIAAIRAKIDALIQEARP